MQVFISRNGEQLGAWTDDEVRRYFQAGNLVITDHFWREGMSQWDTLNHFLPPLISPPPKPPPAPAPPQPPGSPGSAPKFKWDWIKWNKWSYAEFVPLGLAVFMALAIGLQSTSSLAEKCGMAVGSFLFFGLCTFPVSFVFPREWRLVVRCALVLGLGGLVLIGQQASANHKWLGEVHNFAAEQSQDARQQIAQNGVVTDDHGKKMNAELQKLSDMAKNEDAMNRKLSDAAIALLKDINTREEACRAAEQPMLTLGLGPSKMTSLPEMDKRRAAVQDAQKAIGGFVAYLQNLDTITHRDLVLHGVSPAAADGFMKGMQKTGRMQSLLTYWQQEETISGDLLANLDILEKNWRHWHLDNDTVIFDDDSQVALYKADVAKLNADAAAQKVTQQKMLNTASP